MRAVIAELGFFQQVPVKVVGIRRAPAIETGFLPDQTVGRVDQPVVFTGFILDLGQKKLCIIVAILQLRAVRVYPAADQMQVVGILVAGDAAEFVTFGADLAVGVVAERSRSTASLGALNQASDGVPLVVGQGAVFVLPRRLPPQYIVGKLSSTTVWQRLFDQLPHVIPDEQVSTDVWITDRQQSTLSIVDIVGDMPVRIDRLGHVTLGIALILADRVAAKSRMEETVAVLVGCRLAFGWNERNQPPDLVVAIAGYRPERTLLGDQQALVVIGLEMLATLRFDLRTSRT